MREAPVTWHSTCAFRPDQRGVSNEGSGHWRHGRGRRRDGHGARSTWARGAAALAARRARRATLAARAGVRKLVFVSSLGCQRGSSAYHQSKRAGEKIVRDFDGDWVIVRPGSVYGPGDDQISLLLKMVRTMPAIPVLGGGDDTFQPIWHEDLAEACARVVERDDLAREELDIAGPEVTSQNDLIERLSRITARNPVRVPLPDFLAKAGMRALGVVGIEVPFSDSQLAMLREGNVIADPRGNALTEVLGVTPTTLDRGLELLADAQEEQLPEEGVGPLTRKRFWADIERSRR